MDEIIQDAVEALFVVDERGNVIAWNECAEAVTGTPAGNARGRPCYLASGAIDAATGAVCQEGCSLFGARPSPPGVTMRLLRRPRDGADGEAIECQTFPLHLGSAEGYSLCLMTRLGERAARDLHQALAVVAAFAPRLADAANLGERLGIALETARLTPGIVSAEIVLLPPGDASGSPRSHAVGSTMSGLNPAVLDRLALERRPVALVEVAGAETEIDGASWRIVAPIVAQQHLVGTMAVLGQPPGFSIGPAIRVLDLLAGYLSLLFSRESSGILAAAPRPAGPNLRISCLGPLRIERNGEVLPSGQLRRQNALALLELLVAGRHESLTPGLAAAKLWPGRSPATARHHLRSATRALREALEPELAPGQPSAFIESQRGVVGLVPTTRCSIDADELAGHLAAFDAHLKANSLSKAIDRGEAVVSLYRGDFFEDDPDAPWCAAERYRLRELYLNFLPRLAAVHARRGDLDAAIATCRRALRLDALHEMAHRQLMFYLDRSGRRDEALRQFDLCRRLLRAERAREPDALTSGLAASLFAVV